MARYYLVRNAKNQAPKISKLSEKVYDNFLEIYGLEANWMGDSDEVKKLYKALEKIRKSLKSTSYELKGLSMKIINVAEEMYLEDILKEKEAKNQ